MGCCPSDDYPEKHSSFAYSTPSTKGIETSKAPPIVPYIPPDYQGTPEGVISDTDAILLASNYCKDSPFQWNNEVLVHIGCRVLKWHFLVKGVDTESSKTVPMVLSLTQVKDFPIPLTNSTTLDVFANLVCGMANPYILSCEDADYIKDRSILVVIRKFCEKGSIKDLIYGKQNPKHTYREKYKPEAGRPLKPKAIRTFGRHVLEALSVLNAKGIICDCLHSGNVMLDGGIARIVEMELTMLGGALDPDLRELLLRLDLLREGNACEVDVMLFGMLLLEMATGSTYHKMSFITEVEDEFCERQGLSGPDGSVIREILCSIFITCDATVDSLLANPFFGEVELVSASTRLKFQSVEKGLIKSAMAAAAEKRRVVREELQRGLNDQEEERARIDRDAVEVAVMDDVVNRRRVAKGRRASMGSGVGGEGAVSGKPARRMSRRQSSGRESSGSGSSRQVVSASGTPASPGDSVAVRSPVIAEGGEDEGSIVVSPITQHHHEEVGGAGGKGEGGGMPPQYQKLLNIGLAKEQVMHKMLADGFDPATVGW